jgi:SagB-type dehydrogenase family enzyme
VTGPDSRPALAHGLAIVADDDAVIIEGGPRRLRLRARGASLRSLLDRLDGSRTARELAVDLSMAPTQLEPVLRQLDEWGLSDAAPAPTGDATGCYLSRMRSATGGFATSKELADRLATGRVVLAGEADLLRPIADDLRATGITVLHGRPGPGDPPPNLVVVAEAGSADGFDQAIHAYGSSGVPILRVAACAADIQVGPVHRSGQPCCLVCLRRGLVDAGWAADDGATRPPGPPMVDLLAALAVDEILALVGSVRRPSDPATIVRLTPDLLSDRRRLTVDPECPTCARAKPDTALFETYEAWMRTRAATAGWGGQPSVTEQQRLTALHKQRRQFPGSPAVILPRAAQLPGPAGRFGQDEPAAPGVLDLDTLAALLVRVAGRRGVDEDYQRWAPSGGNFGSVAAYVVGAADIVGLPADCLRYDDMRHALVAVHADPLPVAALLESTDLAAAPPDIAVVLVGTVGRLAGKYGPFAYRLTHLDSGCAVTQLSVVARGYGLDVVLARSWSEQLGQLLEIDPDGEIVTAVAGISARDRRRDSCL